MTFVVWGVWAALRKFRRCWVKAGPSAPPTPSRGRDGAPRRSARDDNSGLWVVAWVGGFAEYSDGSELAASRLRVGRPLRDRSPSAGVHLRDKGAVASGGSSLRAVDAGLSAVSDRGGALLGMTFVVWGGGRLYGNFGRCWVKAGPSAPTTPSRERDGAPKRFARDDKSGLCGSLGGWAALWNIRMETSSLLHA